MQNRAPEPYGRFVSPHSPDGYLESITFQEDFSFSGVVYIPLDPAYLDSLDIASRAPIFVLRSRIARLGIHMQTVGPIEFAKDGARVKVEGSQVIRRYHIRALLPKVLVPGLAAGRIVFCDPKAQLGADEIYRLVETRELQLPSLTSIDSQGRILFHPHLCTFEIDRELSENDLLSIMGLPRGKLFLDRIQRRQQVRNIIIEPKDGVITSCTFFLHQHYVVINHDRSPWGQHLQAVALDPIETRSAKVYLEFYNESESAIVNPLATAYIYPAEAAPKRPDKRSFAINFPAFPSDIEDDGEGILNRLYADLDASAPNTRGAWFYDENWQVLPPDPLPEITGLNDFESRLLHAFGTGPSDSYRYDVAGLTTVPAQEATTIVLNAFPNMHEHHRLIECYRRGKLRQIVFRHASVEHGPFLSDLDHHRLQEYGELGIKVYWYNETFRHLSVLTKLSERFFFVPLDHVERVSDALFFAVYGSSVGLPEAQVSLLAELLRQLRQFFGNSLAILTGGGAGVMGEASRVAREEGLLTGANFLEFVDHDVTSRIDFYQTFQSDSRHLRQRWFDIARFHLFCIGGLGTLEEVALTLTDMKLNLTDTGPVILFGGGNPELYWSRLREQLVRMANDGRGPDWLKTNVLVSNDPKEVVRFVSEILRVS